MLHAQLARDDLGSLLYYIYIYREREINNETRPDETRPGAVWHLKNAMALAWTRRYFDPNTIGLDFEGMKSDIAAAPEGSVIILHGCAHNPTGIDPTTEQWEELASLIQSKGHFPFFDVAYQGFASGSLDTDAYSVRLFESKGNIRERALFRK